MTLKNDTKQLIKRLESYDLRSRNGPWTFQLLHLLAKHDNCSFKYIVDKMDADKGWLKRKFKIYLADHLIIHKNDFVKISPLGLKIYNELKDNYRA